MRYALIVLLILIIPFNALKAQKTVDLKTVSVTSGRAVDTVFGTWKFSVADYEFMGDKLMLLTFKKNLSKASLKLTDETQKIISSFDLPDEAEKLYKDYQGYTNVICTNHIYRITIKDDIIHLASLPVEDYRNFIMPCIDTIGKDVFFSNFQKDYPQFTYYAYNSESKKLRPFKTVCDQELMEGYNMEYYFLKGKDQLYAMRIADQYKIDFHRVAANMTGLTSSMYYTPLYAPLFVINDTVCVFDHYSNAILKYDQKQQLLDSVHIDYNHPKNWRDWKHEVIVDKVTNEVYALYERGGFYYLKNIDMKTGKIKGSFKLTNQYVDKIKVQNGFVYYVYRPFESLQEKFVYKELISN
ncbi:MAG: hypothetical protein ACXVPU_05510 [Bacteroidia bacterium]